MSPRGNQQVTTYPTTMKTSQSNVYYRLYDYTSGTDLVLGGCAATVQILDIHASVFLSQRFTVPPHWTTGISGIYNLLTMPGATVCGFEMTRQDGSKVEGIVRDQKDLKREDEQTGHTAKLGHSMAPKNFYVNVGDILSAETVTINLRYIQLLDSEELNAVKFTFPRTYAKRNGTASSFFNSVIGGMADHPFQLNIMVQQAGVIKNIVCTSGHSISVKLGDNATVTNDNSQPTHFASVALVDCPGFLDEDVVLSVITTGLDLPRCFIESYSKLTLSHDTASLALSLVPKFNFSPTLVEMEYIFLVDLSVSLGAESVRLIREALVTLLRGLPTNGTTFNAISLGFHPMKLWEKSRTYTQETLNEATDHIESMQANYGKTEFSSVFSLVDESLSEHHHASVCVFVLTGRTGLEVYSSLVPLGPPRNNAQMVEIQRNYSVYTLSIGDRAPSEISMDTDISTRRKGDMMLFANQGEALIGKCLRLLRAARKAKMPEVLLSEVEWELNRNDVIENKHLRTVPSSSSCRSSNAKNLSLSRSPLIQQSPPVIQGILPDTKTQVYAIIRTPDMSKKTGNEGFIKVVKIKGMVASTGDSIEVEVPISKVYPSTFASGTSIQGITHFPFLHTLAAKALITDCEEGRVPFSTSVSVPFGGGDHAKLTWTNEEREIVHLGVEYGLESHFTKFVGLDKREKKINLVEAHPFISADIRSPFTFRPPRPNPIPTLPSRPPAPLFFPTSVSSTSYAHSTYGIFDSFDMHTNTSLNTSSGADPLLQRAAVRLDSFGSTSYSQFPASNSAYSLDHVENSTDTDTSISTPGAPLSAVARRQEWNGKFLASAELLNLLCRLDTFSNSQLLKLNVDDFGARLVECGIVQRDAGATLIMVIWMERYDMDNVGELTSEMRKKAEKWVESELGVDHERLQDLRYNLSSILASS
ncbi:hypothetical protein GYMLUDRAFT_247059 [Collybiopsis luxurians FD-317 M1]|uniref:VIT domain-containing protein n=1 Tax=Collybiopsis luxurians FD-317 M1 TaxID=944289 RepID=A0A0D0CPX1_9AGAR|nr:hypothetical protein GYMLUDRAFT_247059 [Collybiopsis luxurians FD-317 M1]